jgi:hypothetical protein
MVTIPIHQRTENTNDQGLNSIGEFKISYTIYAIKTTVPLNNNRYDQLFQ